MLELLIHAIVITAAPPISPLAEGNGPPLITSSIEQNYEIVPESPVGAVAPTALGRTDIVVFHLRVVDPDGDPVELQLVSRFEEIQLRRLGESPSDALYEVRVRNRQGFVNKFVEFPDELHFQAWDLRSPSVKVRFVQRFRHHFDIPTEWIGDVTGEGLNDVLLLVSTGGTASLALFPGGNPPAASPTLTLRAKGAGIRSPRVRDLTGDGLPDLVEHGPGILVFHSGPGLAGGSPSITGLVASLGETFSQGTLDFADVTGDGIEDVIAGHAQGVLVWQGPLSAGLPPPTFSLPLGSEPLEELRLHDVTGDGILDIVVPAPASSTSGPTGAGRIFVFRGGPSVDQTPWAILLRATAQALDGVGAGLAFADVTGDGLLDVLSSSANARVNGLPQAGKIFVWTAPLQPGENDVSGSLFRTNSAPDGQRLRRLVDLSGDGACDVVAETSKAGLVLVWLGGPDLDGEPDAVLNGAPNSLDYVAAADVLGDGAPDLVCASVNRIFVWAGGSEFQAGTPAPKAELAPPFGLILEPLLADVTGDGRLDVLASYTSGQRAVLVWASTPGMSGAVRATMTLLSGVDAGSYGPFLRVGDVTGNGHVDVLVAYPGATVDGVFAAGCVCVWADVGQAEGFVERSALLAQPSPTPIYRLGFDMVWMIDLTGDGLLDVVPTSDHNGSVDAETLVFAGGEGLVGRPPPRARLVVPGIGGRVQMMSLFAGEPAYDLFVIERSSPVGGHVFVDPIANPGPALVLGGP